MERSERGLKDLVDVLIDAGVLEEPVARMDQRGCHHVPNGSPVGRSPHPLFAGVRHRYAGWRRAPAERIVSV
ncbi:hypothetical protein GCM10009819_29750 [Agromyces tropicus]|uniref:Uncharacterized protein n=1 Tax=Agromyces tropicus TaxID=555371 RepID=A0ABP5G8W2_9MICO